jgi:hypothetical protein
MTGTTNVLERLQEWYVAQCDGNWEHSFGVTIGTLDNPGWQVRLDLQETSHSGRSFDRVERHRTDHDWLVCWVENDVFQMACGPRNLQEALELFMAWAR